MPLGHAPWSMPRPLKGALLNLLFCQFLTRLAKFEKEIAISDEQKFQKYYL